MSLNVIRYLSISDSSRFWTELSWMTLIKVPGVVHHEPIPSIHINNNSNHVSQEQKPGMNMRKIFEEISKWAIYLLVVLFLALNAFALADRRIDTILILRIYQMVSLG